MTENRAIVRRILRAEYAQHHAHTPTVGDLRDFLKACDEQGIPDGAVLQRHALVFNTSNPFRGLYAERVVDLPRPGSGSGDYSMNWYKAGGFPPGTFNLSGGSVGSGSLGGGGGE